MKFLVFGGGGKVSRHFARLASSEGHEVVSVIRDDSHASDLQSLGATPHIHSLESATVSALVSLLTTTSPDAVVFAAGAGGKGGKERSRAVDYEGAVKVFDAMESANVKRLLLVGGQDVRTREKGWPDWYDEGSKKQSERTWNAIPAYMEAKLDAELELHSRKSLQYTVLRPGGLTEEPAGGCQMGQVQIGKTSRELVAKVLLACAHEPRTEGLTIDVTDGEGNVENELAAVAEERIDTWTG